MSIATLLDGPSAAIVFGGTLLSTVLRCGLSDCRTTLRTLARLPQRGFDAEHVKSELAVQIQEIRQDGLVRAAPHAFGDAEFDDAAGALIQSRSVSALLDRHRAYSMQRIEQARRATNTLLQAADLSPVFGLAGTLISLSQLPGEGMAGGSFAGAISMAVLTTLYGLVGANLLLAPLARAVDRASTREEEERQKLVDWLATQVENACQPIGLRGRDEAA